MDFNVRREVEELPQQTLRQLLERYAELFQENTTSHNKTWLIRRIAWGLQARAEGGLSERARTRAQELAAGANLRFLPPRETIFPIPGSSPPALKTDGRLPPPGTVITRDYKGGQVQVLILRNGFEYEGVRFASLSAVAKRITGSHLNGFRFFQLDAGGKP